jgi:hypothetical protein
MSAIKESLIKKIKQMSEAEVIHLLELVNQRRAARGQAELLE